MSFRLVFDHAPSIARVEHNATDGVERDTSENTAAVRNSAEATDVGAMNALDMMRATGSDSVGPDMSAAHPSDGEIVGANRFSEGAVLSSQSGIQSGTEPVAESASCDDYDSNRLGCTVLTKHGNPPHSGASPSMDDETVNTSTRLNHDPSDGTDGGQINTEVNYKDFGVKVETKSRNGRIIQTETYDLHGGNRVDPTLLSNDPNLQIYDSSWRLEFQRLYYCDPERVSQIVRFRMAYSLAERIFLFVSEQHDALSIEEIEIYQSMIESLETTLEKFCEGESPDSIKGHESNALMSAVLAKRGNPPRSGPSPSWGHANVNRSKRLIHDPIKFFRREMSKFTMDVAKWYALSPVIREICRQYIECEAKYVSCKDRLYAMRLSVRESAMIDSDFLRDRCACLEQMCRRLSEVEPRLSKDCHQLTEEWTKTIADAQRCRESCLDGTYKMFNWQVQGIEEPLSPDDYLSQRDCFINKLHELKTRLELGHYLHQTHSVEAGQLHELLQSTLDWM